MSCERIYNGLCVALGNFDGLHTGHTRVIKKCIEVANQEKLTSAVMLFDEHPMIYLKGIAPPSLLMRSERDEILRNLGIVPKVINFDTVKNLSCEDFVKEVLVGELNAKAVCCGFNYRFGIGSSGNCDTLAELCKAYSIKTFTVEPQNFEGEPVSSTRIRKALLEGNPRLANAMLGRVFSYTLPVIHGDQRGRTMGFPTANQQFPDGFIVPKYGVYASETEVQGNLYASVTNVGVRPTVGGNKLLSETFIVEYDGNLYEKEIRVGLLEYIRGEKTFKDFSQLSKQISSDCDKAKQVFAQEVGNIIAY